MTKPSKSDSTPTPCPAHLRRDARDHRKLSHGEPTFFARKKVFAMFANNHHDDGHIAWIPVAPGVQAMLISTAPKTFFRSPYVGVKGWIGFEMDSIGDEELASLIRESWQLVAPKRLQSHDR